MIRRVLPAFSWGALVKISLSIASLVLFAEQARADLITNGSFELGVFVDDGNKTMILPVGSTTITGWTVITDQLAWIDAGNPWGLSAQDGNRFLDFTAYPTGAPFGGVSQNIATVAGTQYVLSFYLGSYTARWGGPPVSILASAGPSSQTFTVSTTSTSSTWTPFSMLFTASGPTTTVSLTGTAGFQYIGLDNVHVEQVSAVPEPASLPLIVCAFGLLAFTGYRHRSARE
jgi:hypothetical protein